MSRVDEREAATTWTTIEQLFARIPEVADLFADIFESKPAWVTPIFDQNGNLGLSRFGSGEQPSPTYALLLDDSARLTKDDIAMLPGPISQITEVPAQDSGGRHFRVAVDNTGKKIWWDALPLHHSPFERTALIQPR